MASPGRRRAVAPSEPPPAPEPATAPHWCRGLASHSWQLVPPMVLVSHKLVRVTLACARCESRRVDTWQQDTGTIDGHTYDLTDAYHALCKVTRATMRCGLMKQAHPRPVSAATRARQTKGTPHGGEGTALRLVSRARSRRVRH
jgi:hypothetical protein